MPTIDFDETVYRIPYKLAGRTVGTLTILQSVSYEEWFQIYEDHDSGECSFQKIDKKEFDRIISLL